MSSSSAPSPQGSSAGYRIHSSLRFQTLRNGDCGTPLRVVRADGPAPDGELVAEWHPRQGNPFHGRLLGTANGFAFWASDAGWFVVDPHEPSVILAPADDALTLTAEVRMFGVPSSLIALRRGDISMHASAVEIAGRAVILAGPSRYGKTTTAAAFAAAGHRVLTEDMTRCTLAPEPAVYPGPAVMRLRPDVAEGFRLGGETTVVTEGERVFVTTPPELRGTGSPVPLAAVLLLREGTGGAELAEMPRPDAIRDLWTLTFSLPNDASHAATFERVTDLAASLPVFNLRRALRLDELPRIVALVEELVSSGVSPRS